MKHFLLFLATIFLVAGYVSAQECPFGITNDPYPGKCGAYVDTNTDGYCDHGEVSTKVSGEQKTVQKEGEDHICGSIVATQTIAQVATFYAIETTLLQNTLQTYFDTTVSPDMTVGELAQTYNFNAFGINDIATALKEGRKLTNADIDKILGQTISGEQMKPMTLGAIAEYFGVDTTQFLQAIETQIQQQNLSPDTRFQELHDTYGLETKTIKTIVASLGGTTDTQRAVRTRVSDIFFMLDSMFVWGLVGILVVLVGMYHLAKYVSQETIRRIYSIFFYIIVPVVLAGRIYMVSWYHMQGEEVNIFSQKIGYIAVRLLYIILLAKPIVLLLCKTQYKAGKVLQCLAGHILQRRKQLGIGVFYFAFAHMMMFVVLRIAVGYTNPDLQPDIIGILFGTPMMLTGTFGIIALFIGYITSNTISIKRTGMYRKYIQMTAYIAAILTIIHILYVNQTKGIILLILFGIYAGLRARTAISYKK